MVITQHSLIISSLGNNGSMSRGRVQQVIDSIASRKQRERRTRCSFFDSFQSSHDRQYHDVYRSHYPAMYETWR